MKIDLMRKIDYWVGVPVCFLLTVVNYILKLLTFLKRERIGARKILFIKLSEMGTTILAYPLMNKLKRECPEAEMFFLTFKKNEGIFEILNIIPAGNVLAIREDSLGVFILDTLKAILRMRREKIAIVFDLEFFSRFTAILTYLSGAQKRAGFYRYSMEGLYRGNLLTHKVQYNPLLHTSKSYFSLYEVVRLKAKSTPELEDNIGDEEMVLPKYMPSEEIKTRMHAKLKDYGVEETDRLILFNPGEGSLPLREWPLENFIKLGRMLLEAGKNYIIVIGTKEAIPKTELFCKSINDKRCINITGETTLPEVLCLFSIADMLIANDCGLAHLASLTPIKKVILFGPESPQLYSPLCENIRIVYSQLPCSPCVSAFNHRKSACKDNKCLKKIGVDEVFKRLLKKS